MRANPSGVWFFIIGLVICAGVVAAFIAGIVFLVFFILRHNVGAGTAKLRAVVEDWAEDHGYEVLNISSDVPSDHPFKDRFGFGFGKRPAIVRAVEMRGRNGRIRHGWLYVQARLGGGRHGGGLTGFIPESLEVAWED
jgi:hypothetical protein